MYGEIIFILFENIFHSHFINGADNLGKMHYLATQAHTIAHITDPPQGQNAMSFAPL